jgi:hypothetical protein
MSDPKLSVPIPGLDEALARREAQLKEMAKAEASPTGAPVIPTGLVPWLVGVVAVAGALSEVLPEHTIAAHVCRGIFFIGTALGLASPGLRKK